MHNKKSIRYVMLLGLSVLIVLGTISSTAAAVEENGRLEERREIISFAPLPEKEKNKKVSLGTTIEELDLPDTLTATVQTADGSQTLEPEESQDFVLPKPYEQNITSSVTEDDFKKPEQLVFDRNDELRTNTAEIKVPVTWTAEPEYEPFTTGLYIFTPEIGGNFFHASDAVLPTIAVEIYSSETGPTAEPMKTTAAGNAGNLTVNGNNWDYSNHELRLSNNANVTVSGISSEDKIIVENGGNVTLVLSNVNIDMSSSRENHPCALFVSSGSKAEIYLSGTNTLKSGYNYAGIDVSTGAEISIQGDGMISVFGGAMGAGIGGGYYSSAGNITINSGTINAAGNGGGAGIGGGCNGGGGNITITGGTIIGNGAGNGAGIGGGKEGNAGNFSTTSAGNAFIIANSISDISSTDNWNGVIFQGNSGAVYGNSTELTKDAQIPSDYTLTVESGKTLTVGNGVTFTNNGTIVNNGKIINNGTITNTGSITGNDIDIFIFSPTQLKTLAEIVNGGNNLEEYTVSLQNDINISDYGEGCNGNKGWIPIGNDKHNPFKGTFDGGGHTISGLYADRTGEKAAGLFGYVTHGNIKNLYVTDAHVSGANEMGILAGNIRNSTVDICAVNGTVSGNYNAIGEYAFGGLIGNVQMESSVKNCFSNTKINITFEKSAALVVGGAAGTVSASTIENILATGGINVSWIGGDGACGGIAGYIMNNASAVNCVALNPNVTITDFQYNNVGRVVGMIQNPITATGLGAEHCAPPASQNYGFDGMKIISVGDFRDDGEDISASDSLHSNFWSDVAGFSNMIWTAEEDRLPVLQAFSSSQSGDAPDHILVALGVTAAENATYVNMTQSAAADEAVIVNALKVTAETAVNNISITVTVNKIAYTAPIAGTAANPAGINGNCTFTVTVSKGMHNATTTQKQIAITATAHSGGNGGSGDSDSNSNSYSISSKRTEPVTGTVSITAAVNGGSASATITEQNIIDAVANARITAAKKSVNAGEITAVILISSSNSKISSITVNLPKIVQRKIIDYKLSGIQLLIDRPDLSLKLNNAAITEINRQANGDVRLTATKIKASKLGTAANDIIGNRPAYRFTAFHQNGAKSITDFGKGKVSVGIPYHRGKNEAVDYLYAVYVNENGAVSRIADSAYDLNSRSIVFDVSHFSVYGVGYTSPSAKFADVSGHWAKDSIDYVVGRGLLSGISDTAFAPDTAVTQRMLITALSRLDGVNADAKDDSVFRHYIEWAYKKGIMQGTANKKFEPDKAVTREEVAAIFAIFAKATGYTLPVTRNAAAYVDMSDVSAVYKTAVTAIQQAGIMIGGMNNKFNPKSNVTRGEISSMFHRYIKLTIDPATAHGWVLNDDGQYLYYKNGKALTGTQTLRGTKYFFNNNGRLKTGWVKDDAGNLRFYSGNQMLVGFWNVGTDSNNKTYYFSKDGILVSDKWIQIDGKWYYFYADGSIARNTKIDGYDVDENGVRKIK